MLHTEQRDNTLVIGYGTGMSAHVLYEEGYRHIEVAELSKDIVDMADKHFFSINGLVSKKPSVLMHYTDGRNFLLTQDRQYDLISMEISSIWFAGAANLYNKEDVYKRQVYRSLCGFIIFHFLDRQKIQLEHARCLCLPGCRPRFVIFLLPLLPWADARAAFQPDRHICSIRRRCAGQAIYWRGDCQIPKAARSTMDL